MSTQFAFRSHSSFGEFGAYTSKDAVHLAVRIDSESDWDDKFILSAPEARRLGQAIIACADQIEWTERHRTPEALVNVLLRTLRETHQTLSEVKHNTTPSTNIPQKVELTNAGEVSARWFEHYRNEPLEKLQGIERDVAFAKDVKAAVIDELRKQGVVVPVIASTKPRDYVPGQPLIMDRLDGTTQVVRNDFSDAEES